MIAYQTKQDAEQDAVGRLGANGKPLSAFSREALLVGGERVVLWYLGCQR